MGAKWRALGAQRKMFRGKAPAFATFVKDCPQHKMILPAWRKAHSGLGAQWRALTKESRAKYVAAAKQMKGPYDQQMQEYRNNRRNIIQRLKYIIRSRKALMKRRKLEKIQRMKQRAGSSKAKKQKKLKKAVTMAAPKSW